MIYTTGTVASLLRVSRETIRTWSDEFMGNLSAYASPGDGKHRQFSDEDVKVLAFVAQMKRMGRTYEEVHSALNSGEWEKMDLADLPINGSGRSIVELQTQITELEGQLDTISRERDEALTAAAIDRARREDAEKRAADLQARVDDLIAERAVLKYRLEKQADTSS
jgi:excisionase family DNA binding protein